MVCDKCKYAKRLQSLLLLFVFLFLSKNALYAQSTGLQIKGKVIDTETHEPILGASIVVKGTSISTLSNTDGDYQLNVEQDNILQISYIGYTTKEIRVRDESFILTHLSERSTKDNFDIIPIGYGKIPKEYATGAISKLIPNSENKGVQLNIQDALLGSMAGVYVYPGSGEPGDEGRIRVRMGASFAATDEPLILVDGMPIIKSSINFINPNDVESYTVLKDASATAIYGSRASNGVILITTKKGLIGSKDVKVNYSGNISVSQVRKYEDVLSRNEFVEAFNKFNKFTDFKIGEASTDWQKEIYRIALGTDHNISATGGLKNFPYRVSLGYTNQNGIVRNNDYERFNASVNLSPQFFKNHLSVELNIKASTENAKLTPDGVFKNAATFDPTRPVRENYPDNMGFGYYMWLNKDGLPNGASINPVSQVDLIDRSRETDRSVGYLNLNYQIHGFEELKIAASAGYDVLRNDFTTAIPDNTPDAWSFSSEGLGRTKTQKDKLKNYRYDFYAQYDKEFGNHSIHTMIGYGREYDQYEYKFYRENRDYSSNAKRYFKGENNISYYIARMNYSYASKLFLSAAMNIDRTAIFNADNKWNRSPSLAIAYRLSEEKFLKSFQSLSNLKLRFSYGITGLDNVKILSRYFDFTGVRQDLLYMPDLKREKSTTYNWGLDFGFYNDRITGSIDFYTRKTKDALDIVLTSQSAGIAKYLVGNVGDIKNKGVEFSIHTVPIKKANFEWLVDMSFTWNKSKITELVYSPKGYYSHDLDRESNVDIQKKGGQPYSFNLSQQAYDKNGKPLPGKYLNEDGEIVMGSFLNERVLNKTAQAPYYYGLSTQLKYKNWDLGVKVHGAFGQYVYNEKLASDSYLNISDNYYGVSRNVFKNSIETRMTEAERSSDYYLEKGDFFKLDHITLGYTFNKLWNKNSSLRLAFSAQNLFIISKYSGVDPEIYSGIDRFSYLRPRIYALNFSLNF